MNFFDEMAGVWNKTCRYDTGRIEKVLSVLQLKQGDTVKGTADLSKAGELGVVAAYNLLKRMSD